MPLIRGYEEIDILKPTHGFERVIVLCDLRKDRAYIHRFKAFLTGVLLLLAGGCAQIPLGTPTPFPPAPTSHPPQLAFETYRDGNAELYLIDLASGELTNLSRSEAYDGTPSWAPDGSALAFTSERDGNPDIHILEIASAEISRLTDGRGYNVVPSWSPTGESLLFVSNRTYEVGLPGGHVEVNSNGKLWIIDRQGRNRPERATTSLGLDMYGSWAPDGVEFVYMTIRDGNPEIYRFHENGFEENLSNHPARDLNPDWSPDGTQVLFMSNRTGDMEIYRLDLDDGTLTNLTNHPGEDGDPAWSPDGSRIAFISDRDGNSEIYIMNHDGGQIERITFDPADDIHPQWRP